MRETLLLGRVFFSLLFIVAGFGHFSDATIGYAASQGVPYAGLLVPLSGLMAMIGGAMILLGYRAKIGGWVLAAFLVPVTFKMHAFWGIGDPTEAAIQQAMFMKNIALLGGALTYAYFGSGPYSIDNRVAVDERTPVVGPATSMAGTVIPAALRREEAARAIDQEQRASIEAFKANESSRLTGMW
jgi:putative oxidoreductase